MRNVLVVVLNYRVPELVLASVAQLADQIRGHPGCRVVIVDNASGDGSDALLGRAIGERGWSDWVQLRVSPVNGGFAAGNNLAIREALSRGAEAPDYLLILNPDTLPRPGAVRALHDFLESHPEVGIAGSRLEDEDGTQHDSRYRFPSLWSELESRLGLGVVSQLLDRWKTALPLIPASHQIDWVAGASMLVRRQVFEEVGLLDEGYFLYFEETDFCLAARRAGWLCWYVYESRVAHLASRSSGIDLIERRRRLPDYWFESRRRFWVKNHGLLRAALVDAVAIASLAVGIGREWVQRKPAKRPPRMARDMLRHSVFARPRVALRESRARAARTRIAPLRAAVPDPATAR